TGIFCREAKGPVKESSKNASLVNQDFSIYPNPAVDKYTIEFNSDYSGKSTIHITDLMGRILITENLDVFEGNNKIEFDAGGLSKGMYFVLISREGRETRVKNILIE